MKKKLIQLFAFALLAVLASTGVYAHGVSAKTGESYAVLMAGDDSVYVDETVEQCGWDYTWPRTGETYQDSGTYYSRPMPDSTGQMVTYVLHLTLIPVTEVDTMITVSGYPFTFIAVDGKEYLADEESTYFSVKDPAASCRYINYSIKLVENTDPTTGTGEDTNHLYETSCGPFFYEDSEKGEIITFDESGDYELSPAEGSIPTVLHLVVETAEPAETQTEYIPDFPWSYESDYGVITITEDDPYRKSYYYNESERCVYDLIHYVKEGSTGAGETLDPIYDTSCGPISYEGFDEPLKESGEYTIQTPEGTRILHLEVLPAELAETQTETVPDFPYTYTYEGILDYTIMEDDPYFKLYHYDESTGIKRCVYDLIHFVKEGSTGTGETADTTFIDTEAFACGEYTWQATGATFKVSGTYYGRPQTSMTGGTAVEMPRLILTVTEWQEETRRVSAEEYPFEVTLPNEESLEVWSDTTFSVEENDAESGICIRYKYEVKKPEPSTNDDPTEIVEEVSACGQYTWDKTNETYTVSDTYRSQPMPDPTGSTGGSLVVYVLNLTINQPEHEIDNPLTVPSYPWSFEEGLIPNLNSPLYITKDTNFDVYSEQNGNCVLIHYITSSEEATATPDTIYETICGDAYTWERNGETYTKTGIYDYVFDGETIYLNLALLKPQGYGKTVEHAIPDFPYTYMENGKRYTVSADKNWVEIPAFVDSQCVYITHLFFQTDSVIACGFYTWDKNDSTYYETTKDEYATAENTYHLNLTIPESRWAGKDTVTIEVPQFPYTYKDELVGREYVITAERPYAQIFDYYQHDQFGDFFCPYTDYLFVLKSDSTTTDPTTTDCNPEQLESETYAGCEYYEYNGKTYYEPASFYDTIRRATGDCYDLQPIVILIYSNVTSTFEDSACGSYTWRNKTIYDAGVYHDTVKNVIEYTCDSIYSISLVFVASRIEHEVVTAVGSYTFTTEEGLDMTITEDTTFIASKTIDDNGCEIAIELTIKIKQDSTTTDPTVSCHDTVIDWVSYEGCRTFEYNGMTYRQDMTFYDSTLREDGCYDLKEIKISVLQPQTAQDSDYVEAQESYTYTNMNGQSVTVTEDADVYVYHTESTSQFYCQYVPTHIHIIKAEDPTTTDSTTTEPEGQVFKETACGEYFWEVTGLYYTEPGNYDTMVNGEKVTLELTFLELEWSGLDAEEHPVTEFPTTFDINGRTYDVEDENTTVYVYTMVNDAAGTKCFYTEHYFTLQTDSTTTEPEVVEEKACQEYYWEVTGESYWESGEYWNDEHSVLLRLEIVERQYADIDTEAIDSFYYYNPFTGRGYTVYETLDTIDADFTPEGCYDIKVNIYIKKSEQPTTTDSTSTEPCRDTVIDWVSYEGCRTFEYNGMTYRQDMTFYDSTLREDGCYDLKEIKISVLQPQTAQDSDYVEAQEFYTYTNMNGQSVTVTEDADVYVYHTESTSQFYCQYVPTHIHIIKVEDTTTTDSVTCQNEFVYDTIEVAYGWNGLYEDSTNLKATYEIEGGCMRHEFEYFKVGTKPATSDSTTTDTTATCEDVYTYDSLEVAYGEYGYTQDITKYDTAQMPNGCKEISVIAIHVLPQTPTCQDEYKSDTVEVAYGEQNFYRDTVIRSTYEIEGGCTGYKSTFYKVGEKPADTTPAITCEDVMVREQKTACVFYEWRNRTLSQSGRVLDTVRNAVKDGCDSIYTLALTIVNPATSGYADSACGSYKWRKQTLTQTGVYYDTVKNAVARVCDSIYKIHITLIPSRTTKEVVYGYGSYLFTASDGTAIEVLADTTMATQSYNNDGCLLINEVEIHITPKKDTTTQARQTIDTVFACAAYTWHGKTYTKSGVYTDNTSNAILILTVGQRTFTSKDVVVQGNYTYRGRTYTESDMIVDSLRGESGCDSIVVINLRIVNLNVTTIDACDSYTWSSGTGLTYTTSGTYFDSSSMTRLNLSVNYSNASREREITACKSYSWNNKTYYRSGTYSAKLVNVVGCDSTATIKLTIPPTGLTFTRITECFSYTWHGLTYTQSGVYTYYDSASLCGGAECLYLTIRNCPEGAGEPGAHRLGASVIDTTVCDYFVWDVDNLTYTASGRYENNGNVLNLTVKNSTFSMTDTLIYCDQSVNWHGNVYDEDLIAAALLEGAASNGCDSIATLHLKTIDHVRETIDACDEYVWDYTGKTYTQSGTYEAMPHTLYLNINHANSGTQRCEACESYKWDNGVTYVASTNTPSRVVTNAAGCDSVITLNLTIKSTSTGIEERIENGSYTWINGETYTSNAVAQYTLAGGNSQGCDSLVVLALTITGGTEGINDAQALPITVYPNPAVERINIAGVTVLRAELFNIAGTPVRTVENANSVTISGLPSGIYMLRVTTPEGTALRRIVKR